MKNVIIMCTIFLENPEKYWLRVIEERKKQYQNSLFVEMTRAYF